MVKQKVVYNFIFVYAAKIYKIIDLKKEPKFPPIYGNLPLY